jgi:hypothetical protein
MRFLPIVFLGSIFIFPQSAAGQQREVLDFFGSAIRSGVTAAVQADWERVPNAEVTCIDGALRQRGSSINEMVLQGISPADSRMAVFRSQCHSQASTLGPSFDCRRAKSDDEIAICSDPELARLDRLIGEGYLDLVAQIGERAARSVAGPPLAARRSCGGDTGCIRNAQVSAIREFQRLGATIAYVETPSAPVQIPESTTPEMIYSVDGLHLGGHVVPSSPAYLAFGCRPSDQFAGLTWCQRQHQEMHARGPYTSSTTILHSPDGTALYVNRNLQPAFFAGNEAIDDIHRLATKYGEPRYVTAPALPNTPRTLMATWGDVVLQPLDSARLAELAAGRDVRAGILIDHIGNFQRSASSGLPVYRVMKGAGYIWAASWDQNGVGTLRFLTIDASRLASRLPNAGQEVASNLPVISSGQSSPNESRATPAATNSPVPEPLPVPQPASQTPLTSTTTSAPMVAAQPPQPETPKREILAPLPPQAAPAVVEAAPSNSQAVVAQPNPAAAVQSTEAKQQPSRNLPHDEPVQQHVVDPTITTRPATQPPETNYILWALIAAVALLIGAVGFLLFERRQKKRETSTPNTALVPSLAYDKEVGPSAQVSNADTPLRSEQSEDSASPIQEPSPLPIVLPEEASTIGKAHEVTSAPALRGEDLRRSSNIIEHRHFGIGLVAAIVVVSALMSPSIGLVGLLPLALAIYFLPSIIAFKVRHHYAWPLAAINVFFGATGLGWLGILIWALIGPRRSALDEMTQHSALGLSQPSAVDRAILMSDHEIRSGWKMPVVQAEIFSLADEGAPVESAESVKVFFKNPVIGVWRSGGSSSEANSVRYNANTQVRCVVITAAETKLRVGRTLGRTALTGIGAAILTGRDNALGAAFLDYRFGGDEKDEVVAALIVLSDYSSLLVQSESKEVEKFCALLPSQLLSEEVVTQTFEEIDRIKRMAADGPRVLEEMRARIADTEKSITALAEQAKTGETFSERDEGRTGQLQAEARLINEQAVLNAVDRLIRLASNREIPGRKFA